MGIRETLNRHPGITGGVTVALIVVALIIVAMQVIGGGDRTKPLTKAFYTIDDGATTFVDDIEKLPPFDRDGKPAVRAYVFKCPDGKQFVAYLERYTDTARKAMMAAAQNPNGNPLRDPKTGAPVEEYNMTGRELKKPLDPFGIWVKPQDPKYSQVTVLRCPNGTMEGLEPVFP